MTLFIAQIGAERLDWFGFGIGSANRTAAFIACAIVASWAFAAIFKKKRILDFNNIIIGLILLSCANAVSRSVCCAYCFNGDIFCLCQNRIQQP